MDLQIEDSPCQLLPSKNLIDDTLVCREEQLTLYEMSPAQPILPVIVETAALIATPVGATIIKVQAASLDSNSQPQEITCIPTGQGQFIQSQLSIPTNLNQQNHHQTAIHLQHTPHLVTIQVPESSLQSASLQQQQQQQQQSVQFDLLQSSNSVMDTLSASEAIGDGETVLACEANEKVDSNSIELTAEQMESESVVDECKSLISQGPVDSLLTTNGAMTGTTGGQATASNDLLSCLICGKHFVSIGRLKSHEKTHTKSRPFKCIDCGKTFTVRYSLICHTRVHTRERPYSCNLCGSRFSQASSLKTHQIYKHTKDFPYLCRHCGRGFISPGQKHEHILRSHSKQAKAKKGKNSRKAKSKDAATSSSSSLPVEDESIKCHKEQQQQQQHQQHQQDHSFELPQMASTSVQTHLSLSPDSIYQ